MKNDFLPLPIRDRTDECALEIYVTLYRAWQKYQDASALKRERSRVQRFIEQLYSASSLNQSKKHKGKPSKWYVAHVYEENIDVARDVLREYKDIINESVSRKELRRIKPREPGKNSIFEIVEVPPLPLLVPAPGEPKTRREEAKRAAINIILERLLGSSEEKETLDNQRKREEYRKKMEGWKWTGRRVDGLALDLTALQFGVENPKLIHVWRFRARQKNLSGLSPVHNPWHRRTQAARR